MALVHKQMVYAHLSEIHYIVRAVLESMAYQTADVLKIMESECGAGMTALRVDGGASANDLLMQFQADMLNTPVVCTEVDDASALGAVIMNGFARGLWKSFEEVKGFRKVTEVYQPNSQLSIVNCQLYQGWRNAVNQLIK